MPPNMDLNSVEKSLYDLEALLETPRQDVRQKQLAYQGKSMLRTTSWPSYPIGVSSKTPQQPPKQRSKTAYLDGLRGFAALLVYSLHHQVWGHSGVQGEFILENAFGWDGQYYAVCFPGLRILFSGGHLAVAIFFVISGYVLSAGPLRAIYDENVPKVATRVGSALFRRWLRLFIPVLGTTFIWMTSWHLLGIRNGNVNAALPEKTYRDELWKWYCDFKNFSFVFTGEASNSYNDHAWSIPMEFRGSLTVYTVLLALMQVGKTKRLLCEIVLAWYFMYIVDGWFCCLFMIGMIICELDIMAEKDQLPRKLKFLQLPRAMNSWVFYVIFIIGLYLGGVPSISNDISHLRKSPGWSLLASLKPQAVYDFRWFYRSIAATLIMISIPRISALKAFFETSFCQYLGKVSFGLYLVHGPVLWSLGDRIYAATGRVREGHIGIVPKWINYSPFPDWGPFGLELNYLAAHLLLLPVTLWMADVVTRVFDEPSVQFSQWLFKSVSKEENAAVEKEGKVQLPL